MFVRLANIKSVWLIGFIALVSFAMHFRHFSKDITSIHAWRQAETQTTILNFYEEDFNILNPRQNNRGDGDGIFRREFPLMQWLIAGTYKIFGNHLILTRIMMFLFSVMAVAGMYVLIRTLFRQKIAALVAAWTFAFSPSFYYYSINPLPDVFALCCSVWGVAIFFRWIKNGSFRPMVLSAVFLCIGALVKLPFIIFYSVPATFFILELRQGKKKNAALLAIVNGLFLVLPISWYAWVIPQWSGLNIVHGITQNQSSIVEILDYLQHNLISTLPELLLGYGTLLFFLAGVFFLFHNRLYRHRLYPALMVWGMITLMYFFFEINAIGKVHDYYLFPFYPLLFILVAYGAGRMFGSGIPVLRYLSIALVLAAPVLCYARMQGRWDTDSPGFNRDLLVYKQDIRDAVPSDALCIAGNDISGRIFFYYIDKKGWCFWEDKLSDERLENLIRLGAEYLYSDSREIDGNPSIMPYLDDRVGEYGTIKIFRLNKKEESDLP